MYQPHPKKQQLLDALNRRTALADQYRQMTEEEARSALKTHGWYTTSLGVDRDGNKTGFDWYPNTQHDPCDMVWRKTNYICYTIPTKRRPEERMGNWQFVAYWLIR